MSSMTITGDFPIHAQRGAVRSEPWARSRQPAAESSFSGKLYRFHGFRVLDADGKQIGQVDWIWADGGQPAPNGHDTFLGVHLQWLRGKARVIPAGGALVDADASTVHLPYTRDQIKRAPRFSISSVLGIHQKLEVLRHYGRQASVSEAAA